MNDKVRFQWWMSFKDYPFGYSWLYYDGAIHVINLGIVLASWRNGKLPFWVRRNNYEQ